MTQVGGAQSAGVSDRGQIRMISTTASQDPQVGIDDEDRRQVRMVARVARLAQPEDVEPRALGVGQERPARVRAGANAASTSGASTLIDTIPE